MLRRPAGMSLYSSGLLTGVVVDSRLWPDPALQPFHLGRPLRPRTKRWVRGPGPLGLSFQASSRKITIATTCSSYGHRGQHPDVNARAAEPGEAGLSGPAERGAARATATTCQTAPAVGADPPAAAGPERCSSAPRCSTMQGPSLSQATMESIEACEASLCPLLASHVVPCGRQHPLPWLHTRLYQLLDSISPPPRLPCLRAPAGTLASGWERPWWLTCRRTSPSG